MILDAAETIIGLFGFDRTVYNSNIKKNKRREKWYDGIRKERTRIYKPRCQDNNNEKRTI
jgi:hypothetical protein